MNGLTVSDYAISPTSDLFPKAVPISKRLVKTGRAMARMILLEESGLSAIEAKINHLYAQYDELHIEAGITSPPLPSYYLTKWAHRLD